MQMSLNPNPHMKQSSRVGYDAWREASRQANHCEQPSNDVPVSRLIKGGRRAKNTSNRGDGEVLGIEPRWRARISLRRRTLSSGYSHNSGYASSSSIASTITSTTRNNIVGNTREPTAEPCALERLRSRQQSVLEPRPPTVTPDDGQ